jgi:hypothetical protein
MKFNIIEKFLIEDVIYMILKLSTSDHLVLMNIIQDICKYFLDASLKGYFKDVLETRTLIG